MATPPSSATTAPPSHDVEGPASSEAGIFGLECSPQAAEVVLIGVPFDATASYRRRAASGPEAIYRESPQLDLLDPDFGRPYAHGIHMLTSGDNSVDSDNFAELNQRARAAVDQARDGAPASQSTALELANSLCAEMNARVGTLAKQWLDRGKLVGLVGGDHSTPFGLISACAARHSQLGILHLDAHADLRDGYEGFTWSHASIMHNVLAHCPTVSLVQVGVRDYCESELRRSQGDSRIQTFFDRDLKREQFAGRTFAEQAQAIIAALPQEVYVSFDIDGLVPHLCPNTGTPVPGGLEFAEAVYLLETLVSSGRRIVGFDLNEVAVAQADRSDDSLDAIVGARMLYKLCGALLASGRPQALMEPIQ